MKNVLLFLTLTLIIFTPNMNAQTTPLPYYTGFDDASQQNGWQQFRVGEINPFHEWMYTNIDPYSPPNFLLHDYPVGGNTDPVDDWFVSPAFDFTAGGAIDSIRYAFTGFGTPMAGDTVAIYFLNGNANPDMATTKTMLVEFADTLYSNDNVWRIMEDIEIPAMAGNSHIAIRYKTVVNWLDVKFDNIALSTVATGIDKKAEQPGIALYPNPAEDVITIDTYGRSFDRDPLVIDLYNAVGKLVERQQVTTTTQWMVNQPAGIYYYQFSNATQTVLQSGKLIIR